MIRRLGDVVFSSVTYETEEKKSLNASSDFRCGITQIEVADLGR